MASLWVFGYGLFILVNSVGLNWFFYGVVLCGLGFVLGGGLLDVYGCGLFYVWFGLIVVGFIAFTFDFGVFVVVDLVISLVGLIVLV